MVIAIIWMVVCFGMVVGTLVTATHLGRRAWRFEPRTLPITILKPLRGCDPYLDACLGSFFKQIYTKEYEIIFCVEDLEDPACEVALALMRKYPDIDARIVCEPLTADECANPKIRSIYNAYKKYAKHRLILVSDSNVLANSSYLQKLMHDFEGGLMTSIVRGVRPDGFIATVEQAYMNGFLARWLVMTHLFGYPCVLGKSMLFYKSVMEARGLGLLAHGRTLAEDYSAARGFHRAGLQLAISRTPVMQVLGRYRMRDFWARHVRWSRMRKYQAPLAFLAEPFSQMVTLGTVISYATGSVWVFVLHCIAWFFMDYVVIKALGDEMTIPLFCGWVVRECLSPFLWLHAAVGSRVNWRGRVYKLHFGGDAEAE